MDVDEIPATTEAGSVRRRKTCLPGIMGTTCRRFEKQAVQCTYNRPVKRRGPPVRRARRETDAEPPKPVDSSTNIPPPAVEPSVVALSEPSVASKSPNSNDDAILPSPFPSDLYASDDDFLNPEVIETLMQVFYHNIYPMVPYFHWPTFFDRVNHQMYRSDWGTFVASMSICALTIGQLDSGIPVPPGLHGIQPQAATLSSQCYTMAVKAMPSDISNATDYCEAMKASAILASVCLQNEDMKKTVAHLGDYSSLSVMHGFYSEANWPLGLSEIEKEERRRLFWGVYQQQQYISTNFGLPSRQCEAKTTVLYPAEVFDDEDITAMCTRTNPDRVSFLRACNYYADLYRLSENINSMMRAWQQVSREEPAGLLNSFLSGGHASKHFTFEILNLISKLHE
ncbi:uncharacterized protein N7483_012021 [Penicillium malachiteum]|uniref:uncharacterized protein n=1 Tax=Penicillium malachiteum TaxID=1324776 RepID=UPI002547D5D9|nr:uncharacterized protein N7483_012021 [Penicillium malachiteum]KAJ5714840.1 hypothetical protein N7483_012021 [Penicillium malachiteum]